MCLQKFKNTINFQLKEIDTHYFKCLASYDKYPILKLSNKTIANMIGMDFPVDEIAKHSIYGLTEGKRIDHSDLLPVSLEV